MAHNTFQQNSLILQETQTYLLVVLGYWDATLVDHTFHKHLHGCIHNWKETQLSQIEFRTLNRGKIICEDSSVEKLLNHPKLCVRNNYSVAIESSAYTRNWWRKNFFV